MARLDPVPLLLMLGVLRFGSGAAEAHPRREEDAACSLAGVDKEAYSGQGMAGGVRPVSAGIAGPGKAEVEHLLVQKAAVVSKRASGTRGVCLCVFDIDRTLTSKQGRSQSCPGSSHVRGVWDSAYGGGELTLSALATAGLDTTFCGGCYLGVCSAGDAGGRGSRERRFLAERVLTSGPHRALLRHTPEARQWSRARHIHSPFVLGQPDRTKHHAVAGIVDWYRRRGIHIPNSRVHFFGDRTENIGPFRAAGFNAREVSCASRDMSRHHGMVGYCGATPQEVVSDPGIWTCDGSGGRRGSSRRRRRRRDDRRRSPR